jgi:hypothetical protein
MEKNINPEINRLNMETSKNAADSLREWAGLGASKSPVASSFLNGATSQMLKESQMPDVSTTPKNNVVFSFGLVNTVSALKNSSLGDLPAGKILLEKYEHILLGKGVSEAFVFEGLLNDLQSFSWENSVSEALENLNRTFENRRREIEVLKAYESIKNDYETWSPFLNENGIILFHDTCVEELNGYHYGVKKFFDELDLPKVTFTHTFGLGVASKNKELIEYIKNNFDLNNPL